MIEWPIDWAQSLQHQLSHENITDPQPLLDVFRKKKELLNSEFFDLFLPQQPEVLVCLILFGIITAIFFVLFGVFCVARFMGVCGSELYQKHPTSKSNFVRLSAGFALNWLLLALCITFIVTCILRLSSGNRSLLNDSDENSTHLQQLNKTKDHPVRINFNTITITDIDSHQRVRLGEVDVLNIYNNIRELSYEYRPLRNDADVQSQILLFSTLCFFYAAVLATTGTSFIIGCREYLHSYHAAERTYNSNCCGRILVGSAMALFASGPMVFLISTFLFAYIKAYNGICPFIQAQTQNQSIEEYTNTNYNYLDPYNLLDFLNDLLLDRQNINVQNCEMFIRPLQGIWISLILLSVAVLPAIFVILRLSKYFLRMDAENYWNPTETYNTINEKSVPVTPFTTVFSPAKY